MQDIKFTLNKDKLLIKTLGDYAVFELEIPKEKANSFIYTSDKDELSVTIKVNYLTDLFSISSIGKTSVIMFHNSEPKAPLKILNNLENGLVETYVASVVY